MDAYEKGEVMDEKTMEKFLRKLTIIFVTICLVLMAVNWCFSHILNRIVDRELNKKMAVEMTEYQMELKRESDTNLRILSAVANFITSEETICENRFVKSLCEECKQNGFEKISYFDVDGWGICVGKNGQVEKNLQAEEQNAQVFRGIQESWKGKNSTSNLYYEDKKSDTFIAWSVPVWKGNEVRGSMVAYDNSVSFFDILAGKSVTGKYGNVYLVNNQGKIVWSPGNGQAKISFDGNEKENLKKALQNREKLFFTINVDEEKYRAYMEPVSFENMYLVLLSAEEQSREPLYQNVWLTRAILLVILLLSMLYLFIGYRIVRKNNLDLLKVSYTDTLTGAGNMADFSRKLESVLQSEADFSVLAINIRKFKFINEIFGDIMANEFLCDIKEILEKNMTEKEFFCRETADKFYLCLNTKDREIIKQRFTAITEEVQKRFHWYHREYQITLYAGVVTSDELERTHLKKEEVMTHVMFALNRARNAQPDGLRFYDGELHQSEILRNYVESHMAQALKEGEFKLFLQPQKKLNEGILGGAEALVRWVIPEGKIIYPDQFIPVFEKNGFCSELDFYMVEQICRQIREWIDTGKEVIPVAVNQSKLAFYKENYVKRLNDIVEKYQISPELITLEILESILLGEAKELNERIIELKQKGFKISMDDFGSGYSSLNTLSSLDIDELKLDRVFLLKMSEERKEKQQIIMEQIVNLARKMNIITVAEGVETQEQEAFIIEAGCDYGQGYYYSRPVSAQEFTENILGKKI